MKELQLPWMEASILVPLVGAFLVKWLRSGTTAHQVAVAITAATFIVTMGQSIDFHLLHSFEAHDHWDVVSYLLHRDIFVLDKLSAPLLPMASLIYFVVVLSTQRTKLSRFSLPWTLVSESILLATFSCRASWVLVGLMVVAIFPPWLEMRRRERCTRVFSVHMISFAVTLVLGWGAYTMLPPPWNQSAIAVGLISFACLLRSGSVPVHLWTTDLVEKSTFGSAILFLTPLTGAYAVMRFVLPIAPDWIMQSIALVSLFTAAYSAGMAMVQTDARRFFCFLFLSHSSLVLVGLELTTKIGLAGALSVWLSVGLALTGLALTLRAVEARLGRISLKDYHGLFIQMPMLAGFFLLTGLASIGFPGTAGFIATELLVEGAVNIQSSVAAIIVLIVALNSIAILMNYFKIFTGRPHQSLVSLQARPAERLAVLLLSILILLGGLLPQNGVISRYQAADELNKRRSPTNPIPPPPSSEVNHASQ